MAGMVKDTYLPPLRSFTVHSSVEISLISHTVATRCLNSSRSAGAELDVRVVSVCVRSTNWKLYMDGHCTRESKRTPVFLSVFSTARGGSKSPRRALTATSNRVAPYSLITSPVFSSMRMPSSVSLRSVYTYACICVSAQGRAELLIILGSSCYNHTYLAVLLGGYFHCMATMIVG